MVRDHPVVTRLLETGSAEPLGWRLACCGCGCGLYDGDVYYPVAGEIYCHGCMQSLRREVGA